MRHSANLDILRTFAVTSVVIQHLMQTLIAHTGFHAAAVIEFTHHLGQAGVLAFFVHTSLVLMYSLERMALSAEPVTLRFYVRRFFRIYPLSVFCIILALIFHIPDRTWQAPSIITVPVIFSNLFLVQNLVARTSIIGPLWSLPYEVQMYVVLPALYFLAVKRRGVLYLCGLLAFFCGVGFLIFGVWGDHLNMANYVPCFLSGVLCYSLRNRIQAFLSATLWPLFVVLLISAYCLTNQQAEPSFWKGWIFCLLIGLAINAFHNSANKPLNFVAQRIAQYSYGIYLIHVPMLFVVFMVFGIRNLVFGPLLLVGLTMAASIITYHFIESPLIDMGRRLSSRPPRDELALGKTGTEGLRD